jgi:hypothetical protein
MRIKKVELKVEDFEELIEQTPETKNKPAAPSPVLAPFDVDSFLLISPEQQARIDKEVEEADKILEEILTASQLSAKRAATQTPERDTFLTTTDDRGGVVEGFDYDQTYRVPANVLPKPSLDAPYVESKTAEEDYTRTVPSSIPYAFSDDKASHFTASRTPITYTYSTDSKPHHTEGSGASYVFSSNHGGGYIQSTTSTVTYTTSTEKQVPYCFAY